MDRRRLAPLALLALLTALLVAGPAAAQQPEDPGPFPAGWRDVSFVDVIYGQGTIEARLYYPAAETGRDAPPRPGDGPYPLVGFQHGWTNRPSDYDDLSLHLASWGFVVASTGTETGLFPDQAQFARDTRSLLAWADASSGDEASFLFGMVADGPWAASGHSLGGGVLARLIGIEPNVRTIIGLQPAAQLIPGPYENMAAFTGNAFHVAGSVDRLVPPDVVKAWFDAADAARRNVYYELQGAGHSGGTDTPPNDEPMPGDEQARLHRRIVAGLLRAEMKDEEDLYAELLGEGMAAEDVVYESDTAVPPLWVRRSTEAPDEFVVGLAGRPGYDAALAAATARGSRETPYGTLGLDLGAGRIFFQDVLGPTGVAEATLPERALPVLDSVYVQALARQGADGALSRVDAFVAGTSRPALAAAPADAAELGAYPNPFNPVTTVQYRLPAAADVRLAVFDVLGRRVALLADGPHAAGPHTARFDASALPSGVYLVRLTAGTVAQTYRVTVVK